MIDREKKGERGEKSGKDYSSDDDKMMMMPMMLMMLMVMPMSHTS